MYVSIKKVVQNQYYVDVATEFIGNIYDQVGCWIFFNTEYISSNIFNKIELRMFVSCHLDITKKRGINGK